MAEDLENNYQNGPRERFATGSYFRVVIGCAPVVLPIWNWPSGRFTRVSGIGAEFDYETYNEGGTNYPRLFFKSIKTQTLVLEQGTVSVGCDAFCLWMNLINLGQELTFEIFIELMSNTGKALRSWTIAGAHLLKYEGPTLDANRSELAVSRIEFLYNGAF